MMETDLSTAVIFGGSGFVGTHLLRALTRDGRYGGFISYDIKAPVRPVEGVQYIIGDVRLPIAIDDHLPSVDIYNLAAVHATPGHEAWEYFWTNVSGATNICDFASRVGSRLIVFTSSISVYGPNEESIDEKTVPSPVSAYGRSKLQAEAIHRSWLTNGDNRKLVVVRPAVIFGPGEGGNFTRLARLLAKRRFVYPARRNTVKSCGYVGELVNSIAFARDLRQRDFTYNFAYPDRTTSEQICAAFEKVAGFPNPGLTIPLPLMLAAGFGFEILAKLGLRTSINRERVWKLVRSTDVLPTALLQAGYVYKTNINSALESWKVSSKGTFT